ncbi:pentatricopeptide repeat-containing protein At4g20090-like [Mangifera indica]|uniref:pentatricopeptide repeat-containing protein At4g20090-like n=1 Tax=Mangifera indica TaxID=29780 RepID=UPI001CFA0CED|nr:pentatricopeptide repeat-containing protein At4g20090-like [Mangifera indica]XP_044508291.1 pentatricopeptide repeat-containing protein At4g20090-like [Mangifera indica]
MLSVKIRSFGTKPFQILSSTSKLLEFQSFSSSSTIEDDSVNPESKTETLTPQLTQQELAKINLLIPRLCLTNNINTAINLTFTALQANPPPKSLSFSILTHSLTSQPDLVLPMALLTKLKHTPQAHSHLTLIATLLVSSYLRRGRPKDALKVYNWMLRPGSPCKVERVVYQVLVDGLCRSGLVVEGLRVLRGILGMNLVVRSGLRKRVFRSLLREARIKEAKELDEALLCVENGEIEGLEKVLALLDRIIANWTE